MKSLLLTAASFSFFLAANGQHDAAGAAAAAAAETTKSQQHHDDDLPPPRKQPESWQDDIVAWLMSKPNGYFSHKIQWQKTPELGDSYNMYAAEDIEKDETIMIIPQAAIIGSNGTGNECVTIVNLMHEYDKGTESAYYPYIDYLFGDDHPGGTSTGLLPTTWSEAGQDLLSDIVGRTLVPRHFDKGNVFDVCYGSWSKDDIDQMSDATKQRYQDAHIFWLSRSWTDKMVPILDMINHRNGKWLNVESTTAHAGEDIRVYAMRDIARGEQLHNSYNECLDEDCDYGRIMYDYVTPSILMDYGFVEALPRRWIFHVDSQGKPRDEDEFLYVEIDEDPDDGNKLVFDWHFDTPNSKQIKWMERQLTRLEGLDDAVKERSNALTSDHERLTITEYHRAYKEALKLALEHQHDDVSEKTVFFEEEDHDEF